jgi:hypothetical protein
MAINEKSRHLRKPSRLTGDLADKVRVLGCCSTDHTFAGTRISAIR